MKREEIEKIINDRAKRRRSGDRIAVTERPEYAFFDETMKYLVSHSEYTPETVIDYDNVDSKKKAIVMSANRNLADLGFKMDTELVDRLLSTPSEHLEQECRDLITFCRVKTGSKINEAELFYPNFPDEVLSMDEADLYFNAFIAYVTGAVTGENIHYHETPEARTPVLEPFERELKVIGGAGLGDVRNYFHSMIYSAKVIPDNKKVAFIDYLKHYEILSLRKHCRFEDIPVKENRILMTHLFDDKETLSKLLKDPVDVLRYAAYLSGSEDLELKGRVIFRLSKPEQRLIKELLSETKSLYYDIWTRSGLFKSLSRACSMTKNCPERLQKAYDNLWKGRKEDEHGHKIETTWVRLEKMFISLTDRTATLEKVRDFAEKFPGLYQKNFIAMLDKADPSMRKDMIDIYGNVCKYVQPGDVLRTRNILCNEKPAEFSDRWYKNGKNWEGGLPSRAYLLTPELKEHMKEAAEKAIKGYYSGFENPGKVYIDKDLKNALLPANSDRDMSSGSNMVSGSSIKGIKDANIISMAMQWSSNTDLDAGLIAIKESYDDSYRPDQGVCNYHNLVMKGNEDKVVAVHSGDFTHVTEKQQENGGVLEAIDVDKAAAKEAGYKYLLFYVHGYSHGNLKDFPSTVAISQRCGELKTADGGYMKGYKYDDNPHENYTRHLGNRYQEPVFAEKTADFVVNVNNNSAMALLCAVDLDKERIVWIDKGISSDRSLCGLLEGQSEASKTFGNIMYSDKGDMYELFELYAKATGAEIVNDKKEADLIFSRVNLDKKEEGIRDDAQVVTANDLSYILKTYMVKPKEQVKQEETIKKEADKEPVKSLSSEKVSIKEQAELHNMCAAAEEGLGKEALVIPTGKYLCFEPGGNIDEFCKQVEAVSGHGHHTKAEQNINKDKDIPMI